MACGELITIPSGSIHHKSRRRKSHHRAADHIQRIVDAHIHAGIGDQAREEPDGNPEGGEELAERIGAGE